MSEIKYGYNKGGQEPEVQHPIEKAAKEVLDKVKNLGGDGGIVAVDKNGNMVAEFNTAGMYRATMNDKGEITIGIYDK